MCDLVRRWYDEKLCSKDIAEKAFAYTTCFLILVTILFVWINPPGLEYPGGRTTGIGGAPLCNLWAIVILFLTLYAVYCEKHNKTKELEYVRFGLYFLVGISMAVYYDGSNVVNRVRYAQSGPDLLYDHLFLKMDEYLLGWVFPQGQLALWLDKTEGGVTSPTARICNEILQVMYTTYYIWGNALGLFLAYHYFGPSLLPQALKPSSNSRFRVQWRHVQLFVSAWIGAYMLNFLANIMFPAVSPRIFIGNSYTHRIQGYFLANVLRNAVSAAASNTFSAFPSGHCGLSWLAAYLSYRFGLRRYFIVCAVAGFCISLATLVLRYHYFVDMLFAIPLVLFAHFWSGLDSLTDQDTFAYPVNNEKGDIEVGILEKDKPLRNSRSPRQQDSVE